MKKSLTILVIIVTVVAFGFAIYFGIRRARGVPVTFEEEQRPVLIVQRLEKEIDFSDGIDLDFWKTLDHLEIDLLY